MNSPQNYSNFFLSYLSSKNIIQIKAKPASSKTDIVDYDSVSDIFTISIKEPAVDNKANLALLRFLKKLSKKNFEFVSGMSAKIKILKLK